MELNIDPEWFLQMAEKEDNCIISVGGFFTALDDEEFASSDAVATKTEETYGFDSDGNWGLISSITTDTKAVVVPSEE